MKYIKNNNNINLTYSMDYVFEIEKCLSERWRTTTCDILFIEEHWMHPIVVT